MACYQAISHFKAQNTMQYKLRTCTGVQAIESRCCLAQLLHWKSEHYIEKEKKKTYGEKHHIWCTGCLKKIERKKKKSKELNASVLASI